MAWKGDSRKHGLARKGVRTRQKIRYDESSGIWFESRGILGDMVSLVKLMDFDGVMGKPEAKGYDRESYERDASQVIIFPSKDTKRTVKWLMNEYANGNRARKKQLRGILRLAIRQVENKLKETRNVEIRVDLHESRKMLKELEQELK